MYFKDLSKYEYGHSNYPNALNVGWLDISNPFESRILSDKNEILKYLKSLKPQNLYRGVHRCNLCTEDKYPSEVFSTPSGNGEYILENPNTGKVYSSPTLILHYIEVHNYYPPIEWLGTIRLLITK